MLALERNPSTLLLAPSVKLAWRGRLPHLGKRIFISLFFLPFLIVPLVTLSVLAESTPGEFVAAAFFFTFWYGFLALFFWIFGRAMGSWTLIHWDRARRTLTACFSGSFIWLRRKVEIPFARITGVELQLPADGTAAISLTCTVRYEAPGGKRKTLAFPLVVEGVNRRSEALDLCFRIGRALGWKGYAVHRSDHLRTVLELLRSPALHQEAEPIPDVPHDPGYETDAAEGRIAQPEVRIPPFDPAAFHGPGRIAAWRPGAAVHILQDATPKAKLAAAATGMMVFFSLPIAAALLFASELPLWWLLILPAVEVPLFGGIVTFAVLKQAREAREVVLDWETGEARFRTLRHAAAYPLGDIRALAVRGYTATETHRSSSGHTTEYRVYWCEVVALLPGAEEVIAVTDRHRSTPDGAYLDAAAMAADLSKALAISWTWEGFA